IIAKHTSSPSHDGGHQGTAAHGMKDCSVEPSNGASAWVGLDGFQPDLGVLRPFPIQEGFKEFLLSFEIEVDRPSTDASFIGDIAHRGLVISLTDNNGCCRTENLSLSFVMVGHWLLPLVLLLPL